MTCSECEEKDIEIKALESKVEALRDVIVDLESEIYEIETRRDEIVKAAESDADAISEILYDLRREINR